MLNDFTQGQVRKAALEITFARCTNPSPLHRPDGYPAGWRGDSAYELVALGWPDDILLGMERVRAVGDLARDIRYKFVR